MRPPSYYTSLANSNSAHGGAGSSRSSTSQQLRTSLASPSSASYASRTHLPYVAQSALVAHCFTGAGSSTKPYGGQAARASGYASRPSGGYSRSYTSSASSYSSSRPVSTKRAGLASSSLGLTSSAYLGAGSYAPLPRPSYLSGAQPSTRCAYRASAAAYCQPIRLRERPVLTQISRHLNTRQAAGALPAGTSSPPASHSAGVAAETRARQEAPLGAGGAAHDELWSSDVARNISRNKYLIKFRELDKPHQQRQAADERPPPDGLPVAPGELQTCDQQPAAETLEARPAAVCAPDTSVDCDENAAATAPATSGEPGEPPKKAPVKRRNVKLRLKPIERNEQNATNDKPVRARRPAKPGAGTRAEPASAEQAQADAGEQAAGRLVPEQVRASDGELEPAAKTAPAPRGAGQEAGAPAPAGAGRIRFREYKYDDFNFLSVLGHGGWGFVILAELKEHDACFAVKCIKKITIVEDDDFDSIMIERKVLTLGNVHPFICKLFCTFETEGYLFFVMEYCAGGDLMFHVQREGKFSEPRCRFYAAEIICAIRFLHNRHIIYRDLKLDNILLDSRGHIRLVDFGMCQCRTYREEMLPSNFCGTPEYISPEIIKGVPYNHSVDWWSFGVLLYEMAVGKMPFRGSDENELLWNVCYEQIHYPMFLSKELTSLLQLLLEREPTRRMGMATCKAGDIYDQPFFGSIDWCAIEELRVRPPFVPEVTSKRDVQNFDSDFTESACELSPVDEDTLAKIDQTQFQKFPYTNPDIEIFDSAQ